MVAIKICGMQERENIATIAQTLPDYLGFLCWSGSPRFVGESLQASDLINLPVSVKRVGVFVNQSLDEIKYWVVQLNLDVAQLHGDETDGDCSSVRNALPHVEIWKAVAIDTEMPKNLDAQYTHAHRILFDTKSMQRGGSGKTFSWELLSDYQGEKPIVLSGGLGVDSISTLVELCNRYPKVSVLDFNSRLEISPGIKDPALALAAIERVRRA